MPPASIPKPPGVMVPLLQLLLDRGALIDGPDGMRTRSTPVSPTGAGPQRNSSLPAAGSTSKAPPAWAGSTLCNPPRPPKSYCSMASPGPANSAAPPLSHTSSIAASRWTQKLRNHGNTALHWAAYGAHADIVRLLLDRGAPLDVRDQSFDGTPLDWSAARLEITPPETTLSTRWSRFSRRQAQNSTGHSFEERPDGRRNAAKIRSDPRMMAALNGETVAGRA